jgi:hypothetical protein
VEAALAAGVDRMIVQSTPTTELEEALGEMTLFASRMGLPTQP